MFKTLLFLTVVILSSSTVTQEEIPCEIAYEREVVNTNSKRVDLAPQYFFAFSHPEIKNFYKEENFIKTYCQISKNKGLFFLNLNLVLASSVAKEEYGVISNESNLRLHLINGGQVSLRCTNGSLGKSKEDENRTVYSLSYELDKSQVKKLSKYDIDKVELEWSSGVELYEVYDVDAILDQMSCMKKMGLL